ncbi:MAG TPA: FG-GAP-like repeat-containing protein [Candidatus Brocadiia bacterium]|nr:FG-GAP-like repeat-containing protein [Candidatus Brocadiia bacterium]
MERRLLLTGVQFPCYTLQTNSLPRHLLNSDFNSDGLSDLAAINIEDDTVSIFLGAGGGRFDEVGASSTGDQQSSFCVGDFNRDGVPDLATANRGNKDVRIMMGNGDGSFDAPLILASGTNAAIVLVADFNSDGNLDLSVTDADSMVTFLPGTGDGTFGDGIKTSVGIYGYKAVAADFNGDAMLDMAVANNLGAFRILLGNGDGTFASALAGSTATGEGQMTMGDFNNDGKADLAIANAQSMVVSVHMGNGDGTFQPRSDLSAPGNPLSVTTGDFNGDHATDLAAATPFLLNGSAQVFIGNGDGTFQSALVLPAGVKPFSIVSADYDGDGDADLATANYEYSSLTFLANNGDGTFLSRQHYPTGRNCTYVVAGDFNEDAIPDLAVSNAGDSTISVLMGQPGGAYLEDVTYSVGEYPENVHTADIDGDSHVDLIAPSRYGHTVSILFGNGDGTFGDRTDYPVQNNPFRVKSADFNGDGAQDLVVASSMWSSVGVLINNGDGTMRAETTFAVAGNSLSCITDDFNRDGVQDIAATHFGIDKVSVLLGNGDGTFQPYAAYAVGDGPRPIASGDLNGDSIPDIVTGNNSAGNVSVLINNGDGAFATRVDYDVGDGTSGVALGDFNGDGGMDIASANYEGTVSILVGNGDGTLGLRYDFASGDETIFLCAADLDVDGTTDIAAVNWGGNDVAVLLNGATPPSKPVVSVISPDSGAYWPDDNVLNVRTSAWVVNGSVASVTFFADTIPNGVLDPGEIFVKDVDASDGWGTSLDLSSIEPQSLAIVAMAESDAGVRSFDAATIGFTRLELGAPLDAAIVKGGVMFFAVDVPAGQTLLIALDGKAGSHSNAVYARYSMPPSWVEYDSRRLMPLSADQRVVIPMTEAGTYYIMVHAIATDAGTSLAQIGIVADTPDMWVDEITPTSGGVDGSVSVTITGGRLDLAEVATLKRDGLSIAASKFVRTDAGTIVAQFDLSGAPIGEFDLEITQSAGDPLLLSGIFNTVEHTGASIWTEMTSRSVARTGREFSFDFFYGNEGGMDVPNPVFFIEAPGCQFRIGDSGVFYWERMYGIALSRETPTGVMPPGFKNSLHVTVVAPGEETDMNVSAFLAPMDEFSGDYVGLNQVFDWDVIEAKVRPDGVDPLIWNPFWTNLKARLGDDMQSAMPALVEAAIASAADGAGYCSLDSAMTYVIGRAWADTAPPLTRSFLNMAAEGGNPSETYVVVICDAEYQAHTDQQNLDLTMQDADDVVEYFKNQGVDYGEYSGDSHIYVLKDTVGSSHDDIGATEVIAGINWAKERADSNDNIVFYYSGHGLKDDYGSYMILNDGDKIDSGMFNKMWEGTNAGNVTTIMDSCYSGGMSDGFGTYFREDTEYCMITAAEADEKAMTDIAHQNGDLTYHWLKAMSDPRTDADKDGSVTWGEVYMAVESEMGWGHVSHPTIINKESGADLMSAPYDTTILPWAADPDSGLGDLQEAKLLLGDVCELAYNIYGEITSVFLREDPLKKSKGSISKSPVAIRASVDPNHKYDPGVGDGHWILPDGRLIYTIAFENLSTASLPAQTIYITDKLDPMLDWTSVELLGVSSLLWGEIAFPPGTVHYEDRLDKPFTLGQILDVWADVDPLTGLIEVYIAGLDPVTLGLPEDPSAGILPPNNSYGIGEGFIVLSAALADSYPTGTSISNSAQIVFDANAPIVTNNSVVRVDADAPASAVESLPFITPTASFEVAWGGTDAGSGIEYYNIFVAVDRGPFQPWLIRTNETSATYNGADGHVYSFFSAAVDLVGNAELKTASSEATTTVTVPDNTPPDGAIDSPADGFVMEAGDSMNLQGTGTDSDGTVTGWNWQITGPETYNFTSQDPGALKLNTAGVYTITLTVTDDDGAADPTPDVHTVTVNPGHAWDLLGVVSTRAGNVYVYDTDGVGNGIAINGDYDETDGTKYNPYDPANDLLIIGTPGGVIIVANARVKNGTTWQAADFSALGLAVDGKLSVFADQRMGTGDISFLAAKSGIGTAIVNSHITGLPDADLSVPSVMTVPEGTALYAPGQTIGTVIVYGAGDSMPGDVIARDLGTFITGGGFSGDISLTGRAGLVYTGYRGAATLAGDISAASIGTIYSKGPITGDVTTTAGIDLAYATGNISGNMDVGGVVGLYYTTGNATGSLNAGGNIKLFYVAGNASGHVESAKDIPTFFVKGSLTGTGSVIAGGGIGAMIIGMGVDTDIQAAMLGTMVVQKGNLAGTMNITGGTSSISVSAGDVLADITHGGTLSAVNVAGGTFKGTIDARKVGMLMAKATGANGAQRATILADDGLANLFVMGNIDQTDVGVGVRSLPSGKTVELGYLYVGGNVTKTNVLVGVWNENDGSQSAANPFSDGGENGTPYVPAGFAGTAKLTNVFVKGSIGDGSAPTGQWAIASKNKGIWKPKAAGTDYIIDPDVAA